MSKNKKNDEGAFQSDAIKLIHKEGGYVVKIHVSAYQREGEPDLIVCYLGRFIAFELKDGYNKPSKLQKTKMKLIQMAGGISKPVWTLDEIRETLYEVRRIQQCDKHK